MGILLDLDAFYLEHRRCGELTAGVEDATLWMGHTCGAGLARPLPAARGRLFYNLP